MIKILVWRFTFELLNLCRILRKGRKTIKYFAFGANLDPKLLLKRKIKPVDEKEFVLKNYELRFSHPSPFKGTGFASLEPAEDHLTYGKIYTLSNLDAIRMDYYELVPILKRYKRVYKTQEGESFYFYQSLHSTSKLIPTRRYRDYILNGFKNVSHVPVEYLKNLENLRVVEKNDEEMSNELTFFIHPMKRTPKWLKSYDQVLLKLFVRFFRDKSLTERFISV